MATAANGVNEALLLAARRRGWAPTNAGTRLRAWYQRSVTLVPNATWHDISGNNFDLTSAVPDPLYTANDADFADYATFAGGFDAGAGSNRGFASGISMGTAAHAVGIFLATKSNGAVSGSLGYVVDGSITLPNACTLVRASAAPDGFGIQQQTDGTVPVFAAVDTTVKRVVSMIIRPGGTSEVHIDRGRVSASGALAAAVNFDGIANVFQDNVFLQPWDGRTPEIFVIEDPTAQEILDAATYLGGAYGIPLV